MEEIMSKSTFLPFVFVWIVLFAACGVERNANRPAPMPVPQPPETATSLPPYSVTVGPEEEHPTELAPAIESTIPVLRIPEGIEFEVFDVFINATATLPVQVDTRGKPLRVHNQAPFDVQVKCGQNLIDAVDVGETDLFIGCELLYTIEKVPQGNPL